MNGRFDALRPLVSALFLLGAAALAAGCGNASGTDSADEIETVRFPADADVRSAEDAVRAEVDALEGALKDEEAATAAQNERIGELTAELESTTAELVSEQERSRNLAGELDGAALDLAEAERRSSEAEANVAALLAKYDLEIRADAQVAWDAEAVAACEDAGNGSSAIGRYVDHTDQLAIIGTEAELIELVTACAEPLRNRSEQERLSAECEQGSADAVTKDPDGLAGECYVMYVIPWQWDSRTGACNFLGSWDGNNLGMRSFKYDGDGLFRAPPEVCDEDLSGADQDDLLQIWGTLEGAYRYDTAAGGTNEIPDFLIRQAVLISKG